MPTTPQDQLHDLIDDLEDRLAEHGSTLHHQDAIEVLQRLVRVIVAYADTLRDILPRAD